MARRRCAWCRGRLPQGRIRFCEDLCCNKFWSAEWTARTSAARRAASLARAQRLCPCCGLRPVGGNAGPGRPRERCPVCTYQRLLERNRRLKEARRALFAGGGLGVSLEASGPPPATTAAGSPLSTYPTPAPGASNVR